MIRSATNVVYLQTRLRRPSVKERFHVVIAGGGFSGVALAAHLVRSGDSRLEITLLNECQPIGDGTASATELDDHLPDTRAADVSVLEDEPYDFFHWLRRHGGDSSGQEFVNRRSFGAWLEDKVIETSLRAMHADIPFTARAGTRVTDLMHRENTCLVGLHDGGSIRCNAVVLATGDTPSGDALARQALEQRLSLRGMLMLDPLALGWMTGQNGAAICADGRTRQLYVLGPVRPPGRRESTAVPELRRQAAELATALIRASAISDRVRRLARAHAPFAPVL